MYFFFVPSSFFAVKPIVKTNQVIHVLTSKISVSPHFNFWLSLRKNSPKSILKHRGPTQSSPRRPDRSKPSQTSDQLQLIMSRPSNGGQFGELSAELSICVGHWRSERKLLSQTVLKQKHRHAWCKAPETRPVSAELQSQQFEVRSNLHCLLASK